MKIRKNAGIGRSKYLLMMILLEIFLEKIISQIDAKSILIEKINTYMMTSTISSVKMGSSRIPSIRFDILLRDLTLIFENYGDKGFTKEEMKDSILNKNNMGVYKKVKDLKLFGLVEGRLGRYNITDIGKKIVQIDNPERERNIEKAMRLVPLWNLFLDNGGKNITNEKIIEILKNDVGLESEEAQRRSQEIKRVFNRDVLCIKQFNPRFIITLQKKETNVSPQPSNITPESPIAPKLENSTGFKSNEILKVDPLVSFGQEDEIKISKDYGKFHIEITTVESLSGIALDLVKEMRKELKNRGVLYEPSYNKEVPTMGS